MDPSSYKQLTTRRGVKYNYFITLGDTSKPTLLFLHGFPSSSYDWRNQIAFFRKEGYTIIAPDLLGYGGTDKPMNPTMYKHSSMTTDIIDILDGEKVEKAIAIGHDWGSALTSHLVSYYADRFLAFAFLAVGYGPSMASFNYDAALARTKKALGYEAFGYWEFFVENGADRVLRDHWDSFLSIIHTSDPNLWKTDLCPRGALKAWLLADKKAPLAAYFTEEDKKVFTNNFFNGEFAATLNWYRIMVTGITAEDDKQIPESRYVVQQPVFYGAAKLDFVAVPALALAIMRDVCPNLTVKEFDTGHWVQLEAADEVNRNLAAWIGTVSKAKL